MTGNNKIQELSHYFMIISRQKNYTEHKMNVSYE